MIFAALKNLVLMHPAILPYYFMLTIDVADIPRQLLGPQSENLSVQVDRGSNAVWLEHRWLQDGISDEQLTELSRNLNHHQIQYVYPHLTPSDEDGRLPSFSVEAARRFRRVLNQQSPQIRILPWVGGVRFGFRQTRAGTIRLDSDSYLQAFAGECVYLTDQLGFNGIHLNIEPVDSGNRRFLEWLDYIKTRMGNNKILSVAANKPSFVDGLDPGALRSWDIKYYSEVGQYSDQVVIMNYDTGISDSVLYSLFTREKLTAILKEFDRDDLPSSVMLGIPTYENAARHDAKAENISSALQGVRSAMENGAPARFFSGFAIYGYWTTSDAEWKELHDGWLNPDSR
jgi:hypothetical protein